MNIQVVPALESDIDRLMEIQFSAFENDPYHEALYPGDHYSPTVRQAAAERTLKEWREDSTVRFLKCVDAETGVVMGFAKWNFYERERSEAEWKRELVVDWSTGRQKQYAENFLGATMAMRQKVWEGRPHLLLNLLCVHQDHQRKGAGTALVQWGLQASERTGLATYLEASPTGYHLYQKLGFRRIDTIVVKAEDWDGDFDRSYVVMLKEPTG